MADSAIWPICFALGQHGPMDESDKEATQLMLETLFDIKVAVFEIHRALFARRR